MKAAICADSIDSALRVVNVVEKEEETIVCFLFRVSVNGLSWLLSIRNRATSIDFKCVKSFVLFFVLLFLIVKATAFFINQCRQHHAPQE
jgi:hypothetical protein